MREENRLETMKHRQRHLMSESLSKMSTTTSSGKRWNCAPVSDGSMEEEADLIKELKLLCYGSRKRCSGTKRQQRNQILKLKKESGK
ncbi:hypothetical protein RHMOL_Rhmol13G0282100 [Rhododendron molle]|uniref:Uncharacterized protein n=1 Tax=Rhododendron molle TaxID=49168 RepID=A0ACC0LBH5_RHOML|nr:hypothetical protein RHMOL_Rhmol13G0282100 [Rhododendron molle]